MTHDQQAEHGLFRLAAYKGHRVVSVAGCYFCLRCGATPRDHRRVQVFECQPCRGLVDARDMPPRVLTAMREMGPSRVLPRGRPVNSEEQERLAALELCGVRQADVGSAWVRLLERGGECLM